MIIQSNITFYLSGCRWKGILHLWESSFFCFAFNKPHFFVIILTDLIFKLTNSQPGLNLTIMMSSRRLERVQTAEILCIKEHKPETKPRSTGLLSVFSDLISVLLLYINTCKCHVTHYRLPPSLSLCHCTALAKPRAWWPATGWAGNSLSLSHISIEHYRRVWVINLSSTRWLLTPMDGLPFAHRLRKGCLSLSLLLHSCLRLCEITQRVVMTG